MKTHYLFVILCVLILSACASNRLADTRVNGNSFKTYSVKLSNEKEIAYIDVGEGEHTLVFIHGLGSSKSAWARNINILQNRYRCIALDLPGYGASKGGDYTYDMQFFATTVTELIESLALSNVTLVGHSMGGQIVLTMLIDDNKPDYPAVLIAPAGIEQFSEQEASWMKLVYTPAVVKAASEEQIGQNVETNFYDMPLNAEWMISERIAMKDLPTFDAYCDMIPKCVSGMLDQPVYRSLHQIDSPVSILFGSQDKLIPNPILHKDMNTETIAINANAAIPGSSLEIMQNCGHMMQWECDVAVNKAIETFIAGL